MRGEGMLADPLFPRPKRHVYRAEAWRGIPGSMERARAFGRLVRGVGALWLTSAAPLAES